MVSQISFARCATPILVAFLLASQPLFAGTTTTTELLGAVGDSSLIESDLSDPRADGAGTSLFIGTTAAAGGSTFRRSLLRFDIAGSIPAGATVDAVALTLRVNQVALQSGGFQSRLYRVTSPWTEGPTEGFNGMGVVPPAGSGDQTWQHSAFDTQFWTSAGGDFVPDFSGSVLMSGPGTYTLMSGPGPETLEADVQSWLDTPSSNFGWVLRGFEDRGTPSGKRLSSRENSTEPPFLSVTYTIETGPPPTPEDIPTGTTLGLVTLAGLLSLLGWLTIQRR